MDAPNLKRIEYACSILHQIIEVETAARTPASPLPSPVEQDATKFVFQPDDLRLEHSGVEE
jgi:hypothetical protein